MEIKRKIDAFLSSQKHMIIASSTKEGRVEAAYVGFFHDKDFTLFFGTYNTSRKYQNLIENPEVAVVFGSEEGISVQYEGVAKQLVGKELSELKKEYFSKHPVAKKYENDPPQVYFKVVPKWLRWIDTTKEVEEIEELLIDQVHHELFS